MDIVRIALPIVFAAALGIVAVATPAAAQTGSIEFTAGVTPSSGQPEPVRGLTFYLLSKSFQEIRKEGEAAEPKADLNAFIDKLDVSPELKAWMKKSRSVSLSGEEFLHRLKIDDVLGVPEFRDAYVTDNVSTKPLGFPKAKYSENDRERNPEKYKKQKEEYNDALRKFLGSNPQSMDGMDLLLTNVDGSHKWGQLEAQRRARIGQRALQLAQSRYRVAQTQTDLNGRGVLSGIRPGAYWISTLEIQADIGDVRVRWDTPVTVRAGEAAHAELSNFNAVEPQRPAP
jgi:hypothetical protein